MSEKVTIELTSKELAILTMVIRMAGYHRRKELPKEFRRSYHEKVMGRILKKLDNALDG
jgi:hypothetical protein